MDVISNQEITSRDDTMPPQEGFEIGKTPIQQANPKITEADPVPVEQANANGEQNEDDEAGAMP